MSDGRLALWVSYGSSWAINSLLTSVSLTLNEWAHVALVRNLNDFDIYINGTSRAKQTVTIRMNQNDYSLYIGKNYYGNFAGFLSHYRVSRMLARYTANFTPPSAPFETGPSESGGGSVGYPH
jgi:hypothetical protein